MSFLFLLPFCTLITGVHEFHLSKCDIEYNHQDHALQMTLNLFIDDLEKALEQTGVKGMYILTEKESEYAESHIADYLKSKLRVSVDGRRQEITYLGKEAGEDLSSMWCYLEIPQVYPRSSIQVEIDILLEVFDDQRNIVKLQFDKKTKNYFIFEKNDFAGTLSLK